jgi:hypothetical protein
MCCQVLDNLNNGGCDVVSSHTRRFSIVRRFFRLRNRHLCDFSVKKPILLVNSEYTNTHYKMTRFLFEPHP